MQWENPYKNYEDGIEVFLEMIHYIYYWFLAEGWCTAGE